MFKGRLGLEKARIPQADRHGMLWVGRGRLSAEDGCLNFATAGSGDLDAGSYQIPFQRLSFILAGPGVSITHDALRLLARHQTGLLAVGVDGVRFYASMPFGPDDSALARKQASVWADRGKRIEVARAMYKLRMGVTPKQRDLNALRGVEGQHMRGVYKRLAERFGIDWGGRKYDRGSPENTNEINAAINHAATAVQAAAMIAVAVTGTIPSLGFIHEQSGKAFALDIADLYRATITLPVAFEAAATVEQRPHLSIERTTRKLIGVRLQNEKIIPKMIDVIKELLDVDDDPDHA